MYRVTKSISKQLLMLFRMENRSSVETSCIVTGRNGKIKIPTEVLNSSGKDLTIEVKCLYNS